jgi:hypothetical protein
VVVIAADVVGLVTEETVETVDVATVLVQGDAFIHVASVLVEQFPGGIACPIRKGPFPPGGPGMPAGGGAAEAESMRRVSKSRGTSCEGISSEVRDVLRPCL